MAEAKAVGDTSRCLVRLYYNGSVPMQVDGFPKDCARSREGSIHLFPRSGVEMTAAEWDWIQSDVPELAAYLNTQPIPPTPAPVAVPVLEPTPAPDMPAPRPERVRGAKRAEGQPEERSDSDG